MNTESSELKDGDQGSDPSLNPAKEAIVGSPEQPQIERIKALLKSLIEKNESMTHGDQKMGYSLVPSRVQILIGSMDVFLKYGLEQSTVQDLLNAANVSRRTFYKYFKNKIDVIECIYDLLPHLLSARYRNELHHANNLTELVSTCADLFFDYHDTLGPLMRLLHEKASSTGSSVLAQHRTSLQQELVDILTRELWRLEQVRYDRWSLLSIIWATESASVYLLSSTDCTAEDIQQCKASIQKVALAVLIDGRERIALPASDDSAEPGALPEEQESAT